MLPASLPSRSIFDKEKQVLDAREGMKTSLCSVGGEFIGFT